MISTVNRRSPSLLRQPFVLGVFPLVAVLQKLVLVRNGRLGLFQIHVKNVIIIVGLVLGVQSFNFSDS